MSEMGEALVAITNRMHLSILSRFACAYTCPYFLVYVCVLISLCVCSCPYFLVYVRVLISLCVCSCPYFLVYLCVLISLCMFVSLCPYVCVFPAKRRTRIRLLMCFSPHKSLFPCVYSCPYFLMVVHVLISLCSFIGGKRRRSS